ncbi:hypothetical protein ABIE26_005126 [Pedobacter africanus]|uniref:Uncharacterized protein n=1 Tax=Pedobacter africanus TaxID=151894 RepID=A0ACC6L4T4_9SPHI|nr:family 43 glycosylhydrolase [Pedobacter africanus]MDR6786407.1 hypothetical protein [Pedobacter africanus]
MKAIYSLFILLLCQSSMKGQQQTWCNPINIDYTYATRFDSLSYRSGADPAVVSFRNEYYMFVTRSLGYWHSADLLNWNFIRPEKWYFQGSNAPAAFNYKDSILYVAGDPSGSMSILYTDNPKKGDWKATPSILNDLQDPALFIDDDDQAYMFWGSSNVYPIRVKTLNLRNRFLPSKKTYELFKLDGDKHGWERFGENHSDTLLKGYIEGPWMTKHNNKYYLQYAAPGTEFNVYGDGAYIADHPLGPYKYMPNNPFSYKPGGYMNGAGHGATLKGPGNSYWHFATMALDINIGWERRLAMFPTYFDADGLMYSNTRFGDYPHYAPNHKQRKGEFTNWMLLSYKKPVTASGFVQNFEPAKALDEIAKTYWLAPENNDQQWLQVDLQSQCTVYAFQVHYVDHKSSHFGKPAGLFHRYVMEYSSDKAHWEILTDKSKNYTDVPNDYVELERPVKARYIRFKNIHAPTNNLAIGGLRIFGKGSGSQPAVVKNFSAKRNSDQRNIQLNWTKNPLAQGYNVLWGIAPDKLYSSWLVYDNNQLEIKSLGTGQVYYFSIEAFNENGVSKKSEIMKIE